MSWSEWAGLVSYRFSAFWLRSKCSICSYQLNIWYVAHWATTILNWFLELGEVSGACSAFATGWPGIAVPPGPAHSSLFNRSYLYFHPSGAQPDRLVVSVSFQLFGRVAEFGVRRREPMSPPPVVAQGRDRYQNVGLGLGRPVNRTNRTKIWNASRICVSSLRRGHANLLCIVPILVYVPPKRVHWVPKSMALCTSTGATYEGTC